MKKPRGPSATPERVGSSEGLGPIFVASSLMHKIDDSEGRDLFTQPIAQLLVLLRFDEQLLAPFEQDVG